MSGHASGPWLTKDQVLILNETHGYFAYADAQGDVSNAFANQAVEMHERIRSAAPDLLEACQLLMAEYGQLHARYDLGECEGSIRARGAIAKATGATT